MTRLWNALRSGDWLGFARARDYSLIVSAVGLIAICGWIALSDGMIDRNGKPLGTDFSSFYAAGSLALEGHAVAAWDMAAHYARQQAIFGAATPYYAWLYPPIFLLVAAPLAVLPYPLALAAWQFGGLALYLAVIGAIMRRNAGIRTAQWLPLAFGFPAVFVNLGHGQNGFLTAGLFGAALLTLPRRPILAGCLFAALAYKPQFALVIPLALAAAGQWRAIVAAGTAVLALCALSALIFGIESWTAFIGSAQVSQKLLLEQGEVGFEKLQSVFAAVRLWGGGVAQAYALQGLATVAVLIGTFIVWRKDRMSDAGAALLLIATLIASPHVLDYDLMLLGPALAFLASAGLRDGFRDFEISVMALAWVTPLLARSVAGASAIPLGLLATTLLFWIAWRRANGVRESLTAPGRPLAQA